jgi:hypothetical protein
MSSAMKRVLAALVLSGSCASSVAEQPPVAAETPVEYSVLTPAVEARFYVVSGFDPSILIPPYLSLADYGDSSRTKTLRALVEREGYEPGKPFVDRLVQALNDASIRSVHEPISRRPAGRIQSLSWGDLPESPKGRLVFDITIRWLCMCSDIAYSKFYPSIALTWRVLDPRREVVEPGRELVYRHFPAGYSKKKYSRDGKKIEDPLPAYPVALVSEACGYMSVKDAETDPDALWKCFDEAFKAAVDRLIVDLKRVRESHGTVTASTDTRSGISTR